MSDTITFTSVILKAFGRTHKGGTATFSSSLNNTVCASMGWGIGEGQTSAKLEGSLYALSMVLKPAEQALAKHKVDLDIQSVGNFEAVRYEVEGKKGKGFRHEIHFKITFGDQEGCKKLERYILTIGEGKATLAVSYIKQHEGDDGEQQRLISESQARDTESDD
jgi:hypothetical protein